MFKRIDSKTVKKTIVRSYSLHMSLSRSFRNVKVVLGAGKGTSYSMSIFKLCLLAKLNLRLKIIISSYSPHIWCLKILTEF